LELQGWKVRFHIFGRNSEIKKSEIKKLIHFAQVRFDSD